MTRARDARPRRVLLLAFKPPLAVSELPSGAHDFFSYGVFTVQAALVSDPRLEVECRVVDSASDDIDGYMKEIESFAPDILGCSAYMWSFGAFVEVARGTKRLLPDCTVVFGGPSALPSMFELEPYRDAPVDALVVGEGELAFAEIVRSPALCPQTLRRIPGVAVRDGDRWEVNEQRPIAAETGELPSPYQLGLIGPTDVSYIETFRGCPMHCGYCGHGMYTGRVFSRERLARDLAGLDALCPSTIFLVDSAMNVHRKGMRNLIEAHREVPLFHRLKLMCGVYPSGLGPENLEFLSAFRSTSINIGLESLNAGVLRAQNRSSSESGFWQTLEQLAPFLPDVEVHVILGLPGDDPAAFRRTVHRLLELPYRLRVYRCLVLPGGLLDRAAPGWAIGFDPITLELLCCSGWPEATLRAEQEYLDRLASSWPGSNTSIYWWEFPR